MATHTQGLLPRANARCLRSTADAYHYLAGYAKTLLTPLKSNIFVLFMALCEQNYSSNIGGSWLAGDINRMLSLRRREVWATARRFS
jgi:hypothetical protein